VSARLVSLAPSLAGLSLLAASARAQEAPGQPPPPVIVVQPPAPVPVEPVLPVPGYAPYAPYPPPYWQVPQVAPPLLPPREARSPFSAKIWAGPGYRRIYDVNVYAGDFGVALGAQKGASGWYAVMEGMIGRTDHGLRAYEAWVGASWEGVMDRVHLGLGVHVGLLGFVRATTDGTINGMGMGAFGFATVDVVQGDDGHALYLGARVAANGVDGGTQWVAVAAPSVLVGYRY
jgi:hypothetical protein